MFRDYTPPSTRAAPVEIREVGKDGAIKGYISVFGVEDSYRTTFNKGCFARSLEKRNGKPLKMLFNHSGNQVIGRWDNVYEDDHGLFGEGQITQKTERGREITALVEEEILDGLSHGFRTIDYDQKKRAFNEVDVLEASIVTFQSCPTATLREMEHTQDNFLEILSRDTGLTREQVLGVMSGDQRASAPIQSFKDALTGEIHSAFNL